MFEFLLQKSFGWWWKKFSKLTIFIFFRVPYFMIALASIYLA